MAVEFFLMTRRTSSLPSSRRGKLPSSGTVDLFLQVLALDEKGASDQALEETAIEAAAEADRLEQVARQAWVRALSS